MRGGGGFGGGGASGGVPSTRISTGTAWLPIIAFVGLCFMPFRWPKAFRMVIVCTGLLLPLYVLAGDSGWFGLAVIATAIWISEKYMTHTHYRPTKRSIAEKERRVAELTRYDHLCGITRVDPNRKDAR